VSYIESWLKVLENDKRAILSAAAHAQRAADFLRELQTEGEGGLRPPFLLEKFVPRVPKARETLVTIARRAQLALRIECREDVSLVGEYVPCAR
jgi:hypothetical protein